MRCRSCEAAIVWAKFASGKTSPFHADPNGKWVIDAGIATQASETDVDATLRFTSHFATCPQASQWRAKKIKAES